MEVKLVDRDWRTLKFTESNVIRLSKENYILMCVRCNHADGTCQYAICEVCHRNNTPRQRCTADPLSERHLICHHEIRNLQQEFNFWWCAKKYVGSADWKCRPKGCVGCGGMFLLDNWPSFWSIWHLHCKIPGGCKLLVEKGWFGGHRGFLLGPGVDFGIIKGQCWKHLDYWQRGAVHE